MSRTLPTIRVRPVATSTDNPVRRSRTIDNAFRVRHSEFTFLYHPSAALEVRCASSTFNITYLANRSSCRSCLRRYCTSTSLQSFLQSLSRSEVSCSQLDLQTFTWFSRSVEDSSRTLSYLVRRLRCKPSLRICSRSSIVSPPVV